jgi:tRNA pseudouridine38-40 synthase
MVGTLLKVGLGKMSMEQFEEMLQSGKRESAGKSAPAEGLYLVDVKYIGFTRFDAVTPPPVS